MSDEELTTLVKKTRINEDRAAKIQKALLGKFQSHPTPTSGLLIRLQSQIDKYYEIVSEIEQDCLKISSKCDVIKDTEKRDEMYNYSLDVPFNLITTHAELLEKYENLRIKYEGKKEPTSNGSGEKDSVASIGLKLRDIEVPKFHGETRKFPEFKLTFETLVHNNAALSNFEKIAHLRGALKDDAEKVLTDAAKNGLDYPEAWASVCSWYENKAMVLNGLFGDLFSIRRVREQSQLRSLVMEIDSLLRGLKSAGQKTETWGNWVYYYASIKLDEETRKSWLNSRAGKDTYPEWEDLKQFLIDRVHIAEAISTQYKSYPHSRNPPQDERSVLPKKQQCAATTNGDCICCRIGSHLLEDCDQFKIMTPFKRYEFIRDTRLCFKCLATQHNKISCTKPCCKTCNGQHHTLLHFQHESKKNKQAKGDRTGLTSAISSSGNVASNSLPVSEKSVDNSNVSNTCGSVSNLGRVYVLLPTAVVTFECGNSVGLARIMFDCCSQPTLVSDALVNKYKLPCIPSGSAIAGLGSLVQSSHSCNLTLKSRVSPFVIEVNADVVAASTMSYRVPESRFANIVTPPNLLLAEKKLPYNTVDIILGNEYYDKCVIGDKLVFDSVTFKNTHFGWTPTGPVNTTLSSNSIVYCQLSTRTIQDELKRFWEIEEVNPAMEMEPEEVACARHFQETFQRSPSGQFIVRLPLKASLDVLGSSRDRALRALMYSERKMNPELREMYQQFMQEYEDLGHMKLIEPQPGDGCRGYYFSHHPVIRPDSSTTKLRVVFNASAPTKGGPSLNEILMRGPKLQPDLFDILVGFRLHSVEFSADIAKMYRKVLVHEDDRHLQKMWAEKFDWDERVSIENGKEFSELTETVSVLSEFSVQRPYCLKSSVVKRFLVGFCDASERAYCAVVYLKTVCELGDSYVYFVGAKTKVAPIAKTKKVVKDDEDLNIHRLELSGAVLLAQLVQRIAGKLCIQCGEVQAFSDSQVTICWLSKAPENWKTFVQNRVRKVQSVLPSERWRYVRSRYNPANLGTRGSSARELSQSKSWLKGPEFLQSERIADVSLEIDEFEKSSFLIADSQKFSVCSAVNSSVENLSFNISSFSRLLNVVARILRLRQSPRDAFCEEISSAALKRSFIALVKWSQWSCFREEVDALRKNKPLPRGTRLIKFAPFLDVNGVVRVGGRLMNADLPEHRKHPMLVSAKSELILTYARHLHEKYFHAGAKFLSTFLANQFYVIGGVHPLSKRIVHGCVVCARYNKNPLVQQMGQLPPERVRMSSPFSNVMVDYLQELNRRSRWHDVENNLRPGDIVLIQFPKVKPTCWPLGRVSEVLPGPDGLVRRASVQIGGKVYERPLTRIIRLPVENSLQELLPGTVASAAIGCNVEFEGQSNKAFELPEWHQWRSVFKDC